MTNRGWISVISAMTVATGMTVLVDAQKGGGPKPPSELAAVATITCPEATTCGIIGDPSGSNVAKMLTSTNEMNLAVSAASAITLDFGGQTPDNSPPSDCSLAASTCLWNWAQYPLARTFETGFTMQSNTLDPSGEAELEGGLLGIPVNSSVAYQARLNMTITVPETAPGFWRFDFNPNIPPNGGGIPVKVIRTDACTWTFSAVDGEKAALSILVKPPKGKQYAHREGLYSMPFVLTYTVPTLCGG